MVDADSLFPSDSVTTLADELNHAMARDAAARDAYRAVWGVEWEPLPLASGEPYFVASNANVRSESTEASTCVARKRAA